MTSRVGPPRRGIGPTWKELIDSGDINELPYLDGLPDWAKPEEQAPATIKTARRKVPRKDE